MLTAKEELQKAIRDNNPGAINEALDRIRAEKRAAAGQATTVSPNPAANNAGGGKTGVSGGADRPPPTAPTPAQSAKPTASAPRTACR